MFKKLLGLLAICCCLTSRAQYRVTLLVEALPSYHTHGLPLYVAGSFNSWDPGKKEFQLQAAGKDRYAVSFSAPAGKIEFKFTRGSWENGETASGGAPLENRTATINSDTTLYFSVSDWADHFPKQVKRSTAHPRVQIMEKEFFMPQLGRTRRVWVYLPASYGGTKKRYPVLYLHDGQNIFEDTTGFSGEWGVDEALDTLEKQWGETIVVAVDHGGPKRINEYSPYDMDRYGKGEGDLYADFLVKTLQPHIRRHFRVSRKGRDQFIAGSSMGGLISLYTILKYPKKFGGAGIFSPAFWIAPSIKDAVAKSGKKVKGSIYFYAGQQESATMVSDMLAVFNTLNRLSKARMEMAIRSEGKHTESAWRAEFPLFYKFIRSVE